MALPVRGRGSRQMGHQTRHGVTKSQLSRSGLEHHATEGKSPVREGLEISSWISQVAPDPGKPV